MVSLTFILIISCYPLYCSFTLNLFVGNNLKTTPSGLESDPFSKITDALDSLSNLQLYVNQTNITIWILQNNITYIINKDYKFDQKNILLKY